VRDQVKFFVSKCAEWFEWGEPILEVGALQVPGQEGYADLRPFFPGKEYIGVDLRPGPGVDRIEDAQSLSFGDEVIGSVICCETLEHIPDALQAVREMIRVLRPGGTLLITSVMKFEIHDYPSDYWRFTPEAFAFLLRELPLFAVFYEGKPSFPTGVFGLGFKADGEELESRVSEFARELESSTKGWAEPLRLYALKRGTPRRPGMLFQPRQGAIRYQYSIDSGESATAARLLEMVPSGSRVLEVGCGTGHMSIYLRDRLGCEVIAVEVDPEAAREAEHKGVEVVVGDIEDQATLERLRGPFDCAVFADVLEHLRRPDVVLRRIKGLIIPTGTVLASVPNVAFVGVVAELVKGEFRYRDLGILDRDHLRFFTRKTVVELFEKAGYWVDTLEGVKVPLEDTEFSAEPELTSFLARYNPDSLYYEYVIRAVPLPHRIEDRLADMRRLQTRLQEITVKHQQEVDVLVERIGELEAELGERQRILQEIFSSRGWKLLQWLRRIKRLSKMRRKEHDAK